MENNSEPGKDAAYAPGMKISTVGTEEFWELMCTFGALRTGPNSISLRDTLYLTDRPPEDVPGFFEEKIDDIASDLELDEPRPPFFRRVFMQWRARRISKALMARLRQR